MTRAAGVRRRACVHNVRVKTAVAQFAPASAIAPNRATIAGLVDRAAAAGAELVVLPEESMLCATGLESRLGDIARHEWPGFVDFVAGTARSREVAVIAAGYEGRAGDKPYNTVLAVDARGEVLATYRKMHLYDAFAYRESDYVEPGPVAPTTVTIGGFTIGLLDCFDVRFPELARALVDAGADVLSVSAAWVNGPLKTDQWRTMLRARAMENTCWVLGSGSASPECVAQSMIVDPLGVVRAGLMDESPSFTVHDVTRERLEVARDQLPVLRNRRMGPARR